MSKELPTATTDEMLRRFSRELPVSLNEAELQTYGKMLAEKCKEQELAIEKKKQVTADHNNRIKVITNEIKRIADARAKGEELRAVQCGERLRGNVIEIVRLDRGEVVDTRPADLRDLQTTLPGADGPGDFDEGPRGEGLGSTADQPLEDEGEPLEDDEEEDDEEEDDEEEDDEGPDGEMVESSVGDAVYSGAPDDHDEATYEGDVPDEDDETPDNVVRPDFSGVPGFAKGETEDEAIDRKLREREEAAKAEPPKKPSTKTPPAKPTRERSKKANEKKKGKRK